MTTPSVPAGQGSGWLTLDPFGQFLYVVNTIDGTVSEYSIGSDGSLSSLGVVPAGKQRLRDRGHLYRLVRSFRLEPLADE